MLWLMSGCEPQSMQGSGEGVEAPTYERDIKPLLARYCVDCHQSGGVMYAGVELDTYASARSVRVKNTCTAISPALVDIYGDWLLPQAGHGSEVPCGPWEVHSMPPGAGSHLSRGEQHTLARWVAQGAPR